MIIEFVGLPGTGKTTYTRALCNSERFTRVRITSRVELVWFNILFAVRFPITTVRLSVWYIRYRGPRTLWYTKFTSIFLDYNAKFMKARRFRYAVLDQGHLQTLLSLFESPLPEAARRRLLSLLPKADHYVFFNIDETTRTSQLHERGYISRQALMTDEERFVWQATAGEHNEWLRVTHEQLAPATYDVVTEATDLESWVTHYQHAHFMRYITFARMPTEKAHGLQIATMCDEFLQSGHFISLITPVRQNDITQSVTQYYRLKNNLQQYTVAVPDIIGHSRHMNPFKHYLHELLFAGAILFARIPHGVIVYTRTPLIALVASWRGRQVVAEQHYWPERGEKLTAWLLHKAQLLIANSEGTKEAMTASGLTAMVAHNGFPQAWLSLELSQSESRSRLGLTTDLPVVMYVGSLGDWKGVDTLCEAVTLLKNQAQIVVVGGKESEVIAWQKRYPGAIFTGSRPYSDLGWIQKAADVLVVPNNPHSVASERYTSPIKLFAHLASGRPVIVSDLPPIRAIVDEQSVWFFEAGNSDSLAKTITRVLPEGETKTQKILNARKLAQSHTWSARAGIIINLLDIKFTS